MTPETIARIRRLRKQNAYSVNTIANKLGLSRRTVTSVLRGDLTPLNVRTTRRYQQCQDNGGCKPSGIMVIRPFALGDIAVPECRSCRVPMTGRLRKGWAA